MFFPNYSLTAAQSLTVKEKGALKISQRLVLAQGNPVRLVLLCLNLFYHMTSLVWERYNAMY